MSFEDNHESKPVIPIEDGMVIGTCLGVDYIVKVWNAARLESWGKIHGTNPALWHAFLVVGGGWYEDTQIVKLWCLTTNSFWWCDGFIIRNCFSSFDRTHRLVLPKLT